MGGSNGKLYLNQQNSSIIWAISDYYAQNQFNVGGIRKSTNGGLSWSGANLQAQLGFQTTIFTSLAILSDSVVIASMYYYSPPTNPNLPILFTTDQGVTWTQTGNGLPYRFDVWELLAIPEVPGRVFAIGAGKYGLYQSDDYGRNWFRVNDGLPANVVLTEDIHYNYFSKKLYVSMRGYGVFVSSDYGDTFTPQLNLPNVGGNSYSVVVGSNDLFLDDSNFRIWKLNFSTNQFVQLELPDAQDTLDVFKRVSYISSDTFYISVLRRPMHSQTNVDSLQMLLTTNRGATWEYSTRMIDDYTLPISYRRNHGEIVTAYLSMNGQLITNRNFNNQWLRSSLPAVTSNCPSLVVHDTCIFLLDRFGCYYTTNGGIQWTDLVFPNQQGNLQTMGKTFQDTLYFICDTLLWKYNRNTGWSHSNPLPDSCFSIEFINTNPPMLIASNAFTRCYVSQDYGTSWMAMDYSFPVSYPIIYNWEPVYDSIRQVLWLPTSGGLFYAPLVELSAPDEKISLQPFTIGKLEAFPNPSNRAVKIRIELPESVKEGTLTVFNSIGQEVYVEYINRNQSWNREVHWNGESVSSGTYYIRFTSNDLPTPLQNKFTMIK